MEKIKWLFLVYKIPNNPSSKRVYVWRKLKKLGAFKLQDAVFILPYSEKTLEQFQWFASKIVKMDGEATIWESNATTEPQETALMQKFNDNVNAQYDEILHKLKRIKSIEDIGEKENLLRDIIAEYTEIKCYDYFKADLGVKIDRIITRKQNQLNKLKYESGEEQ